MIMVYFAAPASQWQAYEAPLRTALDAAGLIYDLSSECEDPAGVDYIIYAPGGPVSDFTPFIHAKAVLSLWAGVEAITNNETLTMPLTRMVDEGLSEGMTEWVVSHVLRYHLGMDDQIMRQDGQWQQNIPPLARDRKIAILGMGALGKACAQALAALNFQVSGWSRTAKNVDGVTCRHGEDGLTDILGCANIVVLLLPLTPQTENLINGARLALLPKGAMIINPGRGALIDDAALLSAFDSGHISHATLDVFRTEPLPETHVFWAHPNITVTPHIASATRPSSAARMIAQNIKRNESGLPMLHMVDRQTGY
ncbi:MAG TPA: glyoxylate/hydroxypyruvate reductase A [Hellea balneolensis]|uniref:Glyoxylate/hydroxypyruvate reductase A n=1 Tax=Hellea balneolensis TaxID=287478 RepID=A0A7C5LVU5_9PROT|nr:glyoxylate/hydroxypyruvate reductase A [Hellea balneolensis]